MTLGEECQLHAEGWSEPFAVITGGEPMLQLIKAEGVAFLRELRRHGFKTAIETNGTREIPEEVRDLLDHVTVSPKALVSEGGDSSHLVTLEGDDLKVVFPTPFSLETLTSMGASFAHCFLQPKDEGDESKNNANLQAAIEAAAALGWRVSLQTHKHVGLP